MATADQLRAAGFADDEINEHATSQNERLLRAGFSQGEIDAEGQIESSQVITPPQEIVPQGPLDPNQIVEIGPSNDIALDALDGPVEPSGLPTGEVETVNPFVFAAKDVGRAIVETPQNLKIGTIGMAASTLEAVKRRGLQLTGGGVIDDEITRPLFEVVETQEQEQLPQGEIRLPDPLSMVDPLREPLPGSAASQAAGTVTRLPDIGGKLLRKKQQKEISELDDLEIRDSPLAGLARSVHQGGTTSIAVAIGVSLLTGDPTIGLAILGELEGGSAFQEQLDVGGSVRKSLIIAELSEAAEIAGESLVLPKIVGGFKTGQSLKEIASTIAENAGQEGVTGFNQAFLSTFGKETSAGTSKKEAAQKALVAGIKAVPESAAVGGIVGGGAAVSGKVASAVTKPRKTKAADLVDRTIAEDRFVEAEQDAQEEAQAEPTIESQEDTKPSTAKQLPPLSEAEQTAKEQLLKSDVEMSEVDAERLARISTEVKAEGDAIVAEDKAKTEKIVETAEDESKLVEGDKVVPKVAPEAKKLLSKTKVVDDKGEPKTVFHGTPKGFKDFDIAESGKNTDNINAEGAIFFTDDPEIAATFSRSHESDFILEAAEIGIEAKAFKFQNSNIRPAKLNIKNPLIIEKSPTREQIDQAKKDGFDGIITDNDGPTEYAVFSADQIVSSLEVTPSPRTEAKKAVPKKPLTKKVTEKVEKKQKKVELPPEQTTTEKTQKIVTQVDEVVSTDFTTKQVTSARQASIDEDRQALGLKEINSKSRRGWEEALRLAKKQNLDRNADRIADQVNAQPEELGDVRTAGLVIRMTELKNEHREAMAELGKLTDAADIKTKSAEIDRIRSEFDNLSEAVRDNGSEAGRALAAQKLTLNKDFSLIAVLNQAKAAAGKKITKAKEAIFTKLTERLAKKEARIEALELEVSQLAANQIAKRGSRRFTSMTTTQRQTSRQALSQKLNALLKEGCNN